MEENKNQPSALPEIITLMYHRIDTTQTDPWGICVSPIHFEQQIKFLKNHFNVIFSTDLIEQITTGKIINQSICITFDDGYADNYINVKPILEQYNCPATFFISTAFINQTKPFWWDELEMIFLHTKKLPARLVLIIDGNSYEYVFNENELSDAQWKQHKQWKWFEAPPTQQCAAFLDIWEKLRPLSYNDMEMQMEVLRKWSKIYYDNNTLRLPMNEQQLINLSNNNLFTIGLHTHTHPDLRGKKNHFQTEEILRCKKVLDEEYHINANMLAYPYGRFDDVTIDVINQLKTDACFTTEALSINRNTDVNRLGRFQVYDWDISAFKTQLDSWSKKSDIYV